MNKNQLNKIINNLQTYVNDKIDKLPVSYDENLLITVPKESIDKSKADAAAMNRPYIIQIPKDTGFKYTEGMFNNADLIIEYNGKKYIPFIDIYENDIRCILSLKNNDFCFIFPIDNSTNIQLFINKLDTTNITDIKLSMRKDNININDLIIDNSISIGRIGDIGINSSAMGNQVEASGDSSHAVGYHTIASSENSHAEGYYTNASGDNSHAEGSDTTASNYSSHAEGDSNIASGESSHAEGCETIASGMYSHAEGHGSKASSNNSHAEGIGSTASGYASHAEGNNTTSSGMYSHAEGSYTTASGQYQHVQGKYNIEDTKGKYAHIVGNGTDDNAKSNAHTLDWKGNGWYAGKLSQEGTPTEGKDLITKKYFDENNISDAEIDGVFDELSMKTRKSYKITYDYDKTMCMLNPTPSHMYDNDEVSIDVHYSSKYTLRSIVVMQGENDITNNVFNSGSRRINLKSINNDINIKIVIGARPPA